MVMEEIKRPVAVGQSRGTRLAIIVSHPIQYYVPLYRRLAQRDDMVSKVFFTWHGGGQSQFDHGFKQPVQWDIPLTGGYESELVPNVAARPGTHHFWGLRNPELVARVQAWKPDAIHLTGYSFASHLGAMREFNRRGVPLFFRGDSHLLDARRKLRWWLKRSVLRTIFQWPTSFLYVGKANRAYYEAFGVGPERLFYCPHSIETKRFLDWDGRYEIEAQNWRRSLGFSPATRVLLFAGKFEAKKRPLELMDAFARRGAAHWQLLMVGNGGFDAEVRRRAAARPDLFRVLPFQNQSKMPIVYRLGDVFALPSAYDETWGLAVNEALACGRPVLVSDRVGCAADVVEAGLNGQIFHVDDWNDFWVKLDGVAALSRDNVGKTASRFDVRATEEALMRALQKQLLR
jgi:glycosyltransferase involved in cell wall biosynthesis